MMTSIATNKESRAAGRSEASRAEAETILSVESVSKKFCRSLKRSLYYGVQDILVELTGRRRRADALRAGEFWALDDVSFRLHRGEALGLVGPNGAGKSTLLRIISGLIKPDAGAVTVRGRVAPLIALGAGFNPVLTGRENIYANMSILGLSRAEINERFEDVLGFAEIGDALDAPLQTYSSGMAARLGFACAVHTDPEMLLIDEVLAVGDAKFRMKCYRHLARLRESGTSFVLVSHNPNAILSVCTSAIYVSGGKLLAAGSTDEVINRYERDLTINIAETVSGSLQLPHKSADESLGLSIVSLGFKDQYGDPVEAPSSGNPVALSVVCRATKRIENFNLTLLIREQLGEGEWILRLSTLDDKLAWDIMPGEHELRVELPYCGLRPGLYIMKLSVSDGPLFILDAVESFNFFVEEGVVMNQCFFYQPHSWSAVSLEATKA